MGTRNLICVRANRKWAFAKYCQWDGYPTGQGVRLYKFLHIEGNIARLQAGLPHIYEPSEEFWDKMPGEIEAEIARIDCLSPKDLDDYLAQHVPSHVRKRDLEDQKSWILRQSNILFPSLSRDTGGSILELVANATVDHKLPVHSELDFANDWLSCEWAYIVDLDEEQLKVFGRSEPKYEGHPFEDVGDDKEEVPTFVTSFTFSELRIWDDERFMHRANEIETEAEDMIRKHNRITTERLQRCGIFCLSDFTYGNDNNKNDSGKGDVNEGGAEGDDISSASINEDAGEKDTHGRGANHDGADNVASQLDQLDLD
ncbi:hypothetical protein F4806DRAFT_92401 [Annulohypoxylon nitens]|nr:hypothetical protein F4806DRAFT_92401 [Annulohypoxylon nitens]